MSFSELVDPDRRLDQFIFKLLDLIVAQLRMRDRQLVLWILSKLHIIFLAVKVPGHLIALIPLLDQLEHAVAQLPKAPQVVFTLVRVQKVFKLGAGLCAVVELEPVIALLVRQQPGVRFAFHGAIGDLECKAHGAIVASAKQLCRLADELAMNFFIVLGRVRIVV